MRVEAKKCHSFSGTAEPTLNTGQTAFPSVDMQRGFCGEDEYIDAMDHDLSLTQRAIDPIHNMLDTVCRTDIDVVHTREGH